MAKAGVAEAIAAAQDAAGEIVDHEEQEQTLPATTQQAAPPAMPMKKPSMDDAANSAGISSSVDKWLQVSAEGLKIKGEKGLCDDIEVEIDLTEDRGFFMKQSIKWGNPVQYASTYDWSTSDKGGSWADQLVAVQRIAPNAQPFLSADIIFTLTKDVKLKENTIPKGTKLGHSLSMSNWGNWAEFYRQCKEAGKTGQTVTAKLSAEEVNGSNGYTWGVIDFAEA